MTKDQRDKYFGFWAGAKKAQGWINLPKKEEDALRYDIQERALGGVRKSSADLTNKEQDIVLAAFRAISSPSDLNFQIRQIEQERTRLLYRIAQQILVLGLFMEGEDGPLKYAQSIVRDRFATEWMSELSAEPSPRISKATLDSISPKIITDSQLKMLRNTLNRCISKFRQKKDWTEHEMYRAAGLPCLRKDCAQCRDAMVPPSEISPLSAPSAPPRETSEPELAETPF